MPGVATVSPLFKLNLLFPDRIGIVADISRRIADQAMNIVSMEVRRKQQQAVVYMAIDPVSRGLSGKDILEILSGLDGLQSIRFIESMPSEKRTGANSNFTPVLVPLSIPQDGLSGPWKS